MNLYKRNYLFDIYVSGVAVNIFLIIKKKIIISMYCNAFSNVIPTFWYYKAMLLPNLQDLASPEKKKHGTWRSCFVCLT